MKYLSIELIGYKRFKLNQIEYFNMKINNPLQVILGLNGSGKSSLVKELSPLPANPVDFSKTGSKYIKISHHESIYELKSIFTPSQKHSFIKDGIELNNGGTVTVQKELVKTYFGITPDIHSLLLGEEVFNSMSSSRRKEWFIQLCDTNYEYAIKVYNKLRERHRDVTGALKLSKKKLVHETEKLIKTDEEERLRFEVHKLHDNLNFLLEYRKPVESDVDIIHIKQSDLDTQLFKQAKILSDLLDNNLNEKNLTDEMIARLIFKLDNKIASSTALIENISTQYHKNQDKINILEKAEQQTIESLQFKVKDLTLELTQLKDKLLFNQEDFDAITALNSFLSIKTTLSDIYTSIPNNLTKKYSSNNLTLAREKLAELTVMKRKLIDGITQSNAKLSHMDSHKDKPDIDCPSCHHKFSLHYNEDVYTNLQKEINTLEDKLNNHVIIKSKECEEYIENCNQYSILYRQYVQCNNNLIILKPYWDYLSDKNIITDNPQAGITELGLIENDLHNQIQYNNISKSLHESLSLLTSLKDVGGDDLNTLVLCNEQLQNSLNEHTDALQSAITNKIKYTNLLARNKEIKLLTVKIQECVDKKHLLCKEEIESTRRHIFNNTIKVLQSELANKEHILTSVKTQKTIIDSVTNTITELEAEEIALAILVKQLSPTEGLIAEGLFGFISGFVKQMNSLIKKVWTYPLVIKPCELSDDNTIDLDYKFAMSVGTDDNLVSDVNKGSKGMFEIINLAFRLVAMKYLHLQHTPLILDEFAANMDAQHKVQATNIIKSLIEQHVYPQLFIVSHSFEQYSALSNADICVLNNMNILVPKSNTEINHHITMH